MGMNNKVDRIHSMSPDYLSNSYMNIRKVGIKQAAMEKQFNLSFGGTWSYECRMLFPWNTCNFPTQLKKSED